MDKEPKFDGVWMHGDANDILKVVVGQLDEAKREVERLRVALDNRAGELLRKNKFFLVVAHDEPYFMNVYAKIRHREIDIGRWSDEDEELYNEWYSRKLAGEE